MAIEVLPSGRLIRAASQTKVREALQATSRVESMWNRQVLVVVAAGLAIVAATSSGERMVTVWSLVLALAKRANSAGSSTSFGFISPPDPATVMSDGKVMS